MKKIHFYTVMTFLAFIFPSPMTSAKAESYASKATSKPVFKSLTADMFQNLDSDKSGNLNKMEYSHIRSAVSFKKTDTDGNNKISWDEIAAAQQSTHHTLKPIVSHVKPASEDKPVAETPVAVPPETKTN